MSKFAMAMKRFGGFMKRNAFYFLVVLCVASVATVIALAVTYNQTPEVDATINNNTPDDDTPVINPDPNPDTPTPDEPIKKLTFISPCNDGEVVKEYSDTQLVWCPSLKQYATHLALDFNSTDMNVYASADGVVKEVGHNDLDGYYVILTHEDGYVTKYYSLATQSDLKVGAKVEQGQLIGKMSTTQGSESLDGAHLHFEVWKDGAQINPLDVLILSEK